MNNNEKDGRSCFGQFEAIHCICIACIYRSQCMKNTNTIRRDKYGK